MTNVFPTLLVLGVLLFAVGYALYHPESHYREQWMRQCAAHDFTERQCALLYDLRSGQ